MAYTSVISCLSMYRKLCVIIVTLVARDYGKVYTEITVCFVMLSEAVLSILAL